MSSKKAAKIEMKPEVMTTETQQQDDRGKDSDDDSCGNDQNKEIRPAARAVKKEQSEVKSEVKLKVTKKTAKKRKRDNAADYDDGSEDESNNVVSKRTATRS
jgi:hypothetical protein